MTRSRSIIALLFLPSSLVFLGFQNSRAQQQNSATAPFKERERAIVKKTDFSPPVSIKAVKTKGRAVLLDERFIDEDDWLKGFSVSVRNDSIKTVTHVGVRMLFRPADERPEYPAQWSLDYGPNPFFFKALTEVPTSPVPSILPGAEAELKLGDLEFEDLNIFLKKVGFPDQIHVVEVAVATIGFTDGTAWNGNFFKRGSRNGEWKRVEAPRDSSLNIHRQRLNGSIQSRLPEFFFSNNLDGISHSYSGTKQTAKTSGLR